MAFLFRSGLEILASLPKLYWRDDCAPGSEWLKLTRKELPAGRWWFSLDEEEDWSPWVSLPGRKNLGLGRMWHFSAGAFWIVNGLAYVTLLFATGEWTRLVPTSWSIFPDALDTAWTYLHLRLPPRGSPYNPLQQLTYFAVVFLVGPFMIATGLAQAPAIEARFPWILKPLGGRQGARSLHFIGFACLLLFTVGHVFLTIIEGFVGNVDWIVHGSREGHRTFSLVVFWIELALVGGAQVAATWLSLRHPRRVQRALAPFVDFLRSRVIGNLRSRQRYPESAVSPFFRANGEPPESEEWLAHAREGFRNWRLPVGGLVENPLDLTLDDLRAMASASQVTLHNCIQGWTAIAKWGGVPLREVLARARPRPEARYAVFTSYQWMHGHRFYEVLALDLLRDEQTILAIDMDDRPLPRVHGAPCRLRAENLLGYKMVKYLRRIELVERYDSIGQGQGGHREDNRFYARYASI